MKNFNSNSYASFIELCKRHNIIMGTILVDKEWTISVQTLYALIIELYKRYI